MDDEERDQLLDSLLARLEELVAPEGVHDLRRLLLVTPRVHMPNRPGETRA